MNRVCVLLTCNFPYGKSEPFLENEIIYLSQSFDKVFILTVEENDLLNKRELPENCVSIPLQIKRLNLFKTLILSLTSKEKDYRCFNLNPFKTIYNHYFHGRKLQIEKYVYEELSKLNLEYNTIFYSYWNTYLSLALHDAAKKIIANPFVVSRAHGHDLYAYRNVLNYIPFYELSLMKNDFIFPCSDNGTLYLKEKYPLYKDKIITKKLGTNDEGLSPEFKNQQFNIVTCGSFYKLKRHLLIFASLKRIAKKYPNVVWNSFGDGKEYEKIRKKIKRAKLSNKFILHGRLSNSEILNYYSSNCVNLFLNVSTTEGLPVSIMEAISFGIPCMATDVGGTRELVNSDNGWLIDKNLNVKKLSSILEKALNLSDFEITKKRINSRKTWEKLHNSSIVYTDFYNNLLKERG